MKTATKIIIGVSAAIVIGVPAVIMFNRRPKIKADVDWLNKTVDFNMSVKGNNGAGRATLKDNDCFPSVDKKYSFCKASQNNTITLSIIDENGATAKTTNIDFSTKKIS